MSNLIKSLVLGGAIRYLLLISNFGANIQNRIEISTPINSWKRVKEGAFLYEHGINPYSGDIYHENPLLLLATNMLLKYFEAFIPLLFVAIELATSILLMKAVEVFIREQKQKQARKTIAKDVQDLLITDEDLSKIPKFVAIAYLMNPYSILNCVGLTTTVWSNFVLAVFFYSLSQKHQLGTVLALALETQKNLYPFVLIVPAALYLAENSKRRASAMFITGALFIGTFAGLNWLSYIVMNDWSFADATYGFILTHRDFQPNIGLFWYFFMEMFDHFRTLFLYTFQMNATILYLFPLTFKLKHEPIMLATVLTALNAIFRSYPCIGDVAFYLALLPLWVKTSKYMTHKFVVASFFFVTSILGPTVYYLWIYVKSANANFFFGVTLAFCTAQIFLVTDLLFAFIKYEFCLKHGNKIIINGKKGKLSLE